MMKNNKSPGLDGVTAEMLKAGGDTVVSWLLNVCNHAWSSGEAPQDWKDGVVVCIPK